MATLLSRFRRTAAFAVLSLLLGLGAQSPAQADTLYDDLGGAEGVAALTDRFLWNLADDTRINHYFVETNLERFRSKLVEYICQQTEGPCSYSGDDMQRTHANMNVSIAAFNATVENLILAMESLELPTGVQNRLLQILARDFGAVVQDKG